MVLEQTEQISILNLMSNYKKLHDEISKVETSINELEESLKELHKRKDAVIKGIEENRDNEATLIKGLVDKYGEGKMSLLDMSWITNETTIK